MNRQVIALLTKAG